MNVGTYKRIRSAAVFFVSLIISISINSNNALLAISAILIGLLFLTVVRIKAGVITDEREFLVKEKSATIAFNIITPTIAISSLLLLFPSNSGLSVFEKGNFDYLDAIGIIFAYLSLFSMAIYTIAFHFVNKKLGGSANEE